jgi:hypothetical protein
MYFSKVVAALAFAAVAAATPAKRADGINCYYIITPKPTDRGAADLQQTAYNGETTFVEQKPAY